METDFRGHHLGLYRELVRECPLLEFGEPVPIQSVLLRLTDVLAVGTGLPATSVFAGLIAREEDATTAIGKGFAFPHAIVPGECIYRIGLVRAAEGVTYPTPTPPVQALVGCIASPDQRGFHNFALCQMVRAVREPEFLPLWLAAGSPGALRELLVQWSGLS